MTTRMVSVILVNIFFIFSFPGCGLDVFDEEYKTEIEIPTPVGVPQTIEKSKTYKFTGDLDRLESVIFKGGALTIKSPDGSDLSFISRVELYIEYNGDLTLIAEGSSFEKGSAQAGLNPVYSGNLKPMIYDNRFHITWRLIPNRWFRDWSEEGYNIEAKCIFEVDVTL